jgi:Fur family ferric uptake transcriptional regulator
MVKEMTTEPSLYEQARVVLDKKIEELGLRKTQERYRILEEIYKREDHFEIENLFESMLEQNFNVSKATVYNVVELLTEVGLVTRHTFGNNNAARYEKAFGRKQHSHLICTKCSRVVEFCDPRLLLIQNTVSQYSGIQIKEHSLVFYGVCTDGECAKS